jgi:hypothetical protein
VTGLALAVAGLGGWFASGQRGQQIVTAVWPVKLAAPEQPPVPSMQAGPRPSAAPSIQSEGSIAIEAGLTEERPVAGSSSETVSAKQAAGTRVEDLAASERARQTQLRIQREERERIALSERQRALQAQQQAEASARKAPPTEPQRSLVQPEAPSAGPTVDGVCASSSNFIRREICRIRECGKDMFFNDPVCVRFRKSEEDNRQRLLNGSN